jgi:hypothetical protein
MARETRRRSEPWPSVFVLAKKRCSNLPWAGLLAFGSSSPHPFPPRSGSGLAWVVPDHSGGTAPDSHRLPYRGPIGPPRASERYHPSQGTASGLGIRAVAIGFAAACGNVRIHFRAIWSVRALFNGVGHAMGWLRQLRFTLLVGAFAALSSLHSSIRHQSAHADC